MDRQLGQALAGSTPPDVFYVDAARFADYASVGALEPYAQNMGAAFLPALNKSFTADGKLYCVPKDVSTLALEINTDLWKKAGLTLDAGWAGEAFGKGKAAMTIEGNWIRGALSSDYPNIKYTVRELPAGPAGKGTLSFTQCWGIAAKSQHKQQAVAFGFASPAGRCCSPWCWA